MRGALIKVVSVRASTDPNRWHTLHWPIRRWSPSLNSAVAGHPPGPVSKLVWAAVAVAGAICLGVVALRRGEPVNAIWLLAAALSVFAIG